MARKEKKHLLAIIWPNHIARNPYSSNTHGTFTWDSPRLTRQWLCLSGARRKRKRSQPIILVKTKRANWREFLVGGWTNPIEKYESKWESSPSRGEHKKYMSCHHLQNKSNDIYFLSVADWIILQAVVWNYWKVHPPPMEKQETSTVWCQIQDVPQKFLRGLFMLGDFMCQQKLCESQLRYIFFIVPQHIFEQNTPNFTEFVEGFLFGCPFFQNHGFNGSEPG